MIATRTKATTSTPTSPTRPSFTAAMVCSDDSCPNRNPVDGTARTGASGSVAEGRKGPGGGMSAPSRETPPIGAVPRFVALEAAGEAAPSGWWPLRVGAVSATRSSTRSAAVSVDLASGSGTAPSRRGLGAGATWLSSTRAGVPQPEQNRAPANGDPQWVQNLIKITYNREPADSRPETNTQGVPSSDGGASVSVKRIGAKCRRIAESSGRPRLIASGVTTVAAAEAVGVRWPDGARWFRHAAGMPPISLDEPTGRYLSFSEREEIALLRHQAVGVREIARRLGRDPGTISRELRRNTATRSGKQLYVVAQWKAQQDAKPPKTPKLVDNQRLSG